MGRCAHRPGDRPGHEPLARGGRRGLRRRGSLGRRGRPPAGQDRRGNRSTGSVVPSGPNGTVRPPGCRVLGGGSRIDLASRFPSWEILGPRYGGSIPEPEPSGPRWGTETRIWPVTWHFDRARVLPASAIHAESRRDSGLPDPREPPVFSTFSGHAARRPGGGAPRGRKTGPFRASPSAGEPERPA